MKLSDLTAIVRNLTLDRDSVIAAADVATIANDHVNWWMAFHSDRSAYYTSTQSGVQVDVSKFSARVTATNVLRVLSVTRQAAADTIDGTMLDIVSPAHIYHARQLSTTAGTPAMVAFVRLAGSSNRLRMLCHPPASATTYISIHYLPFAADYTTPTVDTTEILDLPQYAQYYVSRETSADIANLFGRDDAFIASILGRAVDAENLTTGMLNRNMGPGAPTERPK